MFFSPLLIIEGQFDNEDSNLSFSWMSRVW